jgi:hypothetical protein
MAEQNQPVPDSNLHRDPYDFQTDEKHVWLGTHYNSAEYRPLDHRFSIAHTGATGELADACRQLESIVFSRYFGDHRKVMPTEYGPYEEGSRFIAVIDHRNGGEVAGCIRTIKGERPSDFKTVRDALNEGVKDEDIQKYHDGFDSTKTLDIGTAAVAESYQGKRFSKFGVLDRILGVKVSHMLYHGLYRDSVDSGIEHWVSSLDQKILHQMHSFGINFVPLNEVPARPYLGSSSTQAAYVRVGDLERTVGEKSYLTRAVLSRGLGIRAVADVRGGAAA